MANHKTRFTRTSMVELLWLVGSLGCAQPCHSGVSGMDTLIVSSQRVQVSAHDLMYGDGTACTLLPEHRLYQCDPTGTEPVRMQIENNKPVRLGVQPDAVTVVANTTFSEEAVRTIIDEMQKGTLHQQEILERARKPLLELSSRAALTETLGLKPGNEDQHHNSTLDDDTTWWFISPDREENLTEEKEISENRGDSLASKHSLEFEETPDPSEKRGPFCQPGTIAVIVTPTSSADAPGQNETEIKQEVKKEPEPETTTNSDDSENSQSLVQPASSGTAGSASVFVVYDGKTVTIKQEPEDEQNEPEATINYSPMSDPPKREPDSSNEPGVYKEFDQCGEEYSFFRTHSCPCTNSDDSENSQSLVQPASSGTAGSASVFVVCDGKAVTIKPEPEDEQNDPEATINYSLMSDPPKREPDSPNEPGVYKECDQCGEEYSFFKTHSCPCPSGNIPAPDPENVAIPLPVKRKHSGQDAIASGQLKRHKHTGQLTQHQKQVHPTKAQLSYVCPHCDKRFTLKRLLTRHQKEVHTTPAKLSFGCSQCDKKFAIAWRLRAHQKTRHSTPAQLEYACPHCDKRFTLKKQLTRHQKEVHTTPERLEYACSQCGKKFALKWRLSIHQKLIHPTPEQLEYACSQCGMKFVYKSSMTQHQKQHLTMEQRPYVCPQCGKKFAYRSELTKHQKVAHPTEGQIMCVCPQCGKKFAIKGQLTQHLKQVHTTPEQLKWACSQCGKKFVYEARLNGHLKQIHTTPAQLKYACSQCGKKFVYKSYLDNHQKQVHLTTEQRPYGCPQCDKKFVYQSHLKNHQKQVHRDKQKN